MLEKRIQTDGHDSLEDAVATMDLSLAQERQVEAQHVCRPVVAEQVAGRKNKKSKGKQATKTETGRPGKDEEEGEERSNSAYGLGYGMAIPVPTTLLIKTEVQHLTIHAKVIINFFDPI